MQIRINEAMKFAKDCGRKVTKKELGALLWPDVPEVNQTINISNLANGRVERIKPEWVTIICAYTGVTPNFLFDF